jgi:hypothetical protein
MDGSIFPPSLPNSTLELFIGRSAFACLGILRGSLHDNAWLIRNCGRQSCPQLHHALLPVQYPPKSGLGTPCDSAHIAMRHTSKHSYSSQSGSRLTVLLDVGDCACNHIG